MLEEGNQRDSGHQNFEEPSIVCAPRTDWGKLHASYYSANKLHDYREILTSCFECQTGLHPVTTQSGKRGWVQLCARLRVLPAQIPHLLGLRDVRAESVWFFEAKQILTPAVEIYPTDSPTSTHCSIEAQGKTCNSKSSREYRFNLLLCGGTLNSLKFHWNVDPDWRD